MQKKKKEETKKRKTMLNCSCPIRLEKRGVDMENRDLTPHIQASLNDLDPFSR